jgi:hypothetical protein
MYTDRIMCIRYIALKKEHHITKVWKHPHLHLHPPPKLDGTSNSISWLLSTPDYATSS